VTATAVPEAKPATKPAQARRPTKLAYSAITAGIALVAAASGQVFQFFPGLRPDPRERTGADLAVFAVEPAVTVDDWLQRTSGFPEDLRRRRDEYIRRSAGTLKITSADRATYLDRRGYVLYVRMTVEGFKRRDVVMRWSMYDNATRRRIHEITFKEAGRMGLDAPTDRSVVELWAPPAPGHDKVFLRIALASNNDGTMLAVTDSPAFSGEVPLG
jgi:hypothetical protein